MTCAPAGSRRSCLFWRLRNAAVLDGAELVFTFRALAWLAMARVALATIGFNRIRNRLEAMTTGSRAGDGYPRAVRRAISRASRTLPGTKCLPQSVAAFVLLRRGGHPAELTIGVAKNENEASPLDAHAWVRSGDLVVTGDHDGVDLSRFSELARVGGHA